MPVFMQRLAKPTGTCTLSAPAAPAPPDPPTPAPTHPSPDPNTRRPPYLPCLGLGCNPARRGPRLAPIRQLARGGEPRRQLTPKFAVHHRTPVCTARECTQPIPARVTSRKRLLEHKQQHARLYYCSNGMLRGRCMLVARRRPLWNSLGAEAAEHDARAWRQLRTPRVATPTTNSGRGRRRGRGHGGSGSSCNLVGCSGHTSALRRLLPRLRLRLRLLDRSCELGFSQGPDRPTPVFGIPNCDVGNGSAAGCSGCSCSS